ncbi:MAG: 5-(carboxyamino)imidazole ribonucleotide synthase [Saprospiraceae bacterium]|nr:5-(carboxyamino)imidazole ribonucleotide synthase [Saprospiraceae bacterium]
MGNFNPRSVKIGILGGGQLGKMLAQDAARLDLDISFLDKDLSYPVAKVCPQFIQGDFNNYEDVLNFGRKLDVISIEIEHVNIEALKKLELEGKSVYPQAHILEFIQDKGLQKQFYTKHHFPTAPFILFENTTQIRKSVAENTIKLPFVQKLCKGGYDGKGVQVINTLQDLTKLLEGPSLIESKAKIAKEVAVIAVRNIDGDCKAYSPVSMDFHSEANLVEDVVCPAEIPMAAQKLAIDLAIDIANKLEIVGLLAVEMFYNEDGSIWINEIAPRPHNSGHITLNNGAISQFENHLRAILGHPLGQTLFVIPSLMMNLLGEPGYSGHAIYSGFDEIMDIEGVHVYLYGKEQTKPFRKMGHINITGLDLKSCKEKAIQIRSTIKIIS